jgi:peroxiredoxin
MSIRRLIASFAVFSLGLVVHTAVAQDAAIPLGTPMPGQDVGLVDASGGTTTLAALKGSELTTVVFWGNRCPWIIRYEDRIKLLSNELGSEAKVFVLVNSNDASAFPAESAEASATYASEKGLRVSYLSDARSDLARAFGASRTPQAFVFDAAGTLVYSGAIDDSPGDPDNVSKQYLRDALLSLGRSQPVSVPETKAFGCMIRPVQ